MNKLGYRLIQKLIKGKKHYSNPFMLQPAVYYTSFLLVDHLLYDVNVIKEQAH